MREYGDNTRDPASRRSRMGWIRWIALLAAALFLLCILVPDKLIEWRSNCLWQRAEEMEAEGRYEDAIDEYLRIDSFGWQESALNRIIEIVNGFVEQGDTIRAFDLLTEKPALEDVLPYHDQMRIVAEVARQQEEAGNDARAIELYGRIGYDNQISLIYYHEGEAHSVDGRYLDAAAAFMRAAELGSEEARQAAEAKLDEMRYKTPEDVPLSTIAAGTGHTVAVRTDGTVVAVGDNRAGQCRVTDWQGVLSVAAGDGFTLGLTESGDVLFAGENDAVESAVAGWKGVRRIAAGRDCAVALLRDGQVLVAGCDDPGWTDAVSVFAGGSRIGCIQTDGTVLLSGGEKQLNVSGWKGAVVLAMSDGHAVALLSDGSATGGGELKYGQSRVKEWTYRRTLAASEGYTLGLLLDGTVRYAGNASVPMLRARDWTGIVAIAAGETHAVGLREDGTVVAVGHNSYGQLNVSDWEDIRTPDKEGA